MMEIDAHTPIFLLVVITTVHHLMVLGGKVKLIIIIYAFMTVTMLTGI